MSLGRVVYDEYWREDVLILVDNAKAEGSPKT
jgi:hypothetical protein